MLLGFKRRKIQNPKPIGKLFKQTREKKGLDLIQVEKETSIRLKYLKAIENDKPGDFPAEVYFFNFLRRYAEYLGFDGNQLIKKYNATQLYNEKISKDKSSGVLGQSSSPFLVGASQKNQYFSSIVISPQVLLSFVTGVFVLCLLSYAWFQVKSFAAAPNLEIKNPSSEIAVSLDAISVEGKTDVGASLYVNSEAVEVDRFGHFEQKVKLISGLNTIEITAQNKANKETKKIIQVLAKY